jgi:hypothetical protein
MGATNSYSEAAWELTIASLKSSGECTLISRRLLSFYPAPLDHLLNPTAKKLRKIQENSKAF